MNKLQEALTPAKNNKLKWNTDDSELELSAFDKVMMECDQEGPVKFTDFLDLRYSYCI